MLDVASEIGGKISQDVPKSRRPSVTRMTCASVLVIWAGGLLTSLHTMQRTDHLSANSDPHFLMTVFKISAYQVTVCLLPTFQTEWLFGVSTGGTKTSRAVSCSMGAAETSERNARMAKTKVERKFMMLGELCVLSDTMSI